MRRVAQTINLGLIKNSQYGFSDGAEFLKMVENYFDKAGRHTHIRPDKLNFYKKPENVVKCSITLVRGTIFIIQMMAKFK